ncbi:peptide ABC transporter permease [Arthrobacter glacialis]|nr:peptide ABC transporter permease [Arthrobacter glacialis]
MKMSEKTVDSMNPMSIQSSADVLAPDAGTRLPASSPAVAPRGRGKRSRAQKSSGMARGLKSPLAIAGLTVVAVCILAGLLAPFLTPYAPTDQQFDAFEPMSSAHPLGTDELGRDLFSRLVFGIRVNILVAFTAVPAGALLGAFLGILASSKSWYAGALQRFFDMMLAFTALVMGMTVAALMGPGLGAVLVTVALVNVPLFGRITRNAVMAQLGRDYAEAAQVVGVSHFRLMTRHILPNSVDALIVRAALSLSLAVFIEGAMSFVGIGIRLPDPSMGSMLKSSVGFLEQAPQYAIAPMIVVTLLVLGFNMISDGLNKGLLKR